MNGLLFTLIFTSFAINQNAMAQSRLLEGVKRNPDEAESICKSFRELNKENISSGSQKSIQRISSLKNISEVDAEILSMYVRGLYCPDTF
jgi:flagellar motor switch protein FliM